jgi:hypothetical protein
MTYAIFTGFAATYALWVFYLAVMSLKHARDRGMLTRTTLALGYPVLVIGLILDFCVNVFVMTPLFLELPREATVTARLKRHNRTGTGWRQRLAAWFEPILDPFDPSGDHI